MKNKILTISIIFILLSFIFINNNVFAASYDLSDYKNKVGSNSYLIIYDETSSTFYLFVSSGTGYFIGNSRTLNDNKYVRGAIHCSSTYGSSWSSRQMGYYVYSFDYSTNTFINKTSYSGSDPFRPANDMLIIATNTNYYFWEETTPFFQTTPVPSKVFIAQTILAEKLEKVEMKEPIITTIVGLAALLIPLLICLLGFWKAWRLLSKILHKS